MKIALKFLFLLTMIKPGYACLQPFPAPEDSAPQQNTIPDTPLLLQRNVQLSTEFMILFRMGLEDGLKSLQKLQRGISELGNIAYLPELVRNVRDTDLAAYWNAIQETKNTLDKIEEYTQQVRMGILREQIVSVREIEAVKRKATNTFVSTAASASVAPDWSGPR